MLFFFFFQIIYTRVKILTFFQRFHEKVYITLCFFNVYARFRCMTGIISCFKLLFFKMSFPLRWIISDCIIILLCVHKYYQHFLIYTFHLSHLVWYLSTSSITAVYREKLYNWLQSLVTHGVHSIRLLNGSISKSNARRECPAPLPLRTNNSVI